MDGERPSSIEIVAHYVNSVAPDN